MEIVEERPGGVDRVQDPFQQHSPGLWDGQRLSLSYLGKDSVSKAVPTGAITACGEMNNLVNPKHLIVFFTDVTHLKI